MTKLLKTLAIAGAAAIALSSPALASDTDAFSVKRTNTPHIKLSVKAYQSGDFARAAKLSETALTRGLSAKRGAIAQSNLCASYAMLGETEKAVKACDAALALNPDLAEAKSNKAALTVKLAAKTP